MPQPGLLGLVFGLRGRITGISWLPRSGLLRLPLARRITAPSWNIRRGGGKFALPQTLYLAAITREYLSRYPVKPLCNVRRKHRLQRLRADASPRLFRVLKRLKACKGSPGRECAASRFLVPGLAVKKKPLPKRCFAIRCPTCDYPNFLDTHHQVGSEATLSTQPFPPAATTSGNS